MDPRESARMVLDNISKLKLPCAYSQGRSNARGGPSVYWGDTLQGMWWGELPGVQAIAWMG